MSLTPEQRALRRTGLGSSDLGAIANLNPFWTPYDVYCDKRGLLEEQPETLPMRVGNIVEGLIAALYSEETGAELFQGRTCVHPEIPWVVATPDRWRDRNRLVEIKWVGWRQAAHWARETDGIPSYVRAQIEWQMFATGAEQCDVAALIAGEEFRIYTITRHEPLLQHLRAIAERFWFQHVVPGIPPPVDGSESAREMVERLFPDHRPPLKVATHDMESIVEALMGAQERRRLAEYDVTMQQNRLGMLIGEADGIEGSFGKVTWRRSKGHTKRTMRLWPRKDDAA